jgi:hypothetical protein
MSMLQKSNLKQGCKAAVAITKAKPQSLLYNPSATVAAAKAKP